MKTKILLSTILLLGFLFNSNAQTFKNGDFNLNAGIGLGYTYSLYSGATSWPALVVSADKGVKDLPDLGVLSIGGTIGYKHISASGTGYDWSWSDLYVGARGALHFSSISSDKLDVYGGVSLGLRFYTYPTVVYDGFYDLNIEKKTHTGGFFGIYGGAKYSFTDKIGGFAELGYDIAWLKLGVSFKL